MHSIRDPIDFVSGLDPAKPLYESNGPDERIADGDAKFVDVIHTNSDTLGLHAALGDIDFYPNGGKSQPRCASDTSTEYCSRSRRSHGRA